MPRPTPPPPGSGGCAAWWTGHPQGSPSVRRDLLKAFPTSDELIDWNYWQREVLAYQSGLAATAYAGLGITAPAWSRCSPLMGGVELWLADARRDRRLRPAARVAGPLRRELAPRRPARPAASPSSRGCPVVAAEYWSRPATGSAVDAAAWDDLSWRAGRAVRCAGSASCGRAGTGCAVVRGRRTHRVPPTSGPPNLIDDAGTSALFDWSFAGEGALGEDVANLVVDAFTDGLMDVALLLRSPGPSDGYLAGAAHGGLDRLVRRVRRHPTAAPRSTAGSPAPAVGAVRDDLGRRRTARTRPPRRPSAANPVGHLIADWAASTS